MILLCHDPACEGHDVQAGGEPEDDCAFCGRPLLDENQCIITSQAPLADVPQMENPVAALLCAHHGHVFEGRLIHRAHRLVGRCERCGVGIISDGS